MKWSEAKRLAEERIAAAPASSTVVLTLYATEEDYLELTRGEGWTWLEHAQVMRAAARSLKRKGCRVHLVTITAAGYRSWLNENGGPDDQARRAIYAESLIV